MATHRAYCITLDNESGRERWSQFEKHCRNVDAAAAGATSNGGGSSGDNGPSGLLSAMDVHKTWGVVVGDSRGQRMTGCARAHMKCADLIEAGIREGRDAAGTILEDDARFASREALECWVRNVLPEMLRQKADLVLAGVHGVQPMPRGERGVIPVPGCTCTKRHTLVQVCNYTGFFMYSPLTAAARKALHDSPPNYNIDVHVGRKSVGPNPSVRAYCVYPFIADCRPCVSNIKGDYRDYTSFFDRCVRLMESAVHQQSATLPQGALAPPRGSGNGAAADLWNGAKRRAVAAATPKPSLPSAPTKAPLSKTATAAAPAAVAMPKPQPSNHTATAVANAAKPPAAVAAVPSRPGVAVGSGIRSAAVATHVTAPRPTAITPPSVPPHARARAAAAMHPAAAAWRRPVAPATRPPPPPVVVAVASIPPAPAATAPPPPLRALPPVAVPAAAPYRRSHHPALLPNAAGVVAAAAANTVQRIPAATASRLVPAPAPPLRNRGTATVAAAKPIQAPAMVTPMPMAMPSRALPRAVPPPLSRNAPSRLIVPAVTYRARNIPSAVLNRGG